jgi:hypothetical protein
MVIAADPLGDYTPVHYRRIAIGTKTQYPAISRMGASVSPPLARSTYPKKIVAKAIAHQTKPRQERGAVGAFRDDVLEARSATQ